MQLMHSIRSIAVALIGAAVLATSASAGGEPKNQWPFTRPVGARAAQSVAPAKVTNDPPIQGERKNELPFTRPVGGARPATVVIQSDTGFSWTDAGIGLLAGLGLAATGAGVLSLAHKAPQPA